MFQIRITKKFAELIKDFNLQIPAVSQIKRGMKANEHRDILEKVHIPEKQNMYIFIL